MMTNKRQRYIRNFLVAIATLTATHLGSAVVSADAPKSEPNAKIEIKFGKVIQKPTITWDGLGEKGPFSLEFELLGEDGGKLETQVSDETTFTFKEEFFGAGARYKITITNIKEGKFAEKIFITPKPHEKVGPAEPVFFLRRTFHGDKDSEPALLAFTKEIDSEPTYALDFALGVRSDVPRYFGSPERETTFSVLPEASIEGRLGSAQVAEDAWRFRLGLLHLVNFQKRQEDIFAPRGSIISNISWKYETDQAWRTEKMLAEWFVTPVYLRAAIGQFQRSEKLPNIQFTFRPGFGLEAGGTIEHGPSKEEDGTLLRGRLLAGILVRFNHLGSLLESIDLTADNSLYYLPLEGESHNLFTAGIAFNFNEMFSLNFKYKAGSDAPNFQRIETIEGGIGLKF